MQYSAHWTAQSALHVAPGRPVHSGTNSSSLGNILTIPREDYSLTCPPPSIARYLCVHLSKLGRRRENENTQTSKRWRRGFEPGLFRLRVRHSTAEPQRITFNKKIGNNIRAAIPSLIYSIYFTRLHTVVTMPEYKLASS